jgi:hypothetical protein
MGAFIFGISSDTPQSLDYTIRFARDCGIALAQLIPMTPLPGTVDFHQMRRGKMAVKMIKEDYDYWLDPEHPRILYHHPSLTEQELLDKVVGLAEFLQLSGRPAAVKTFRIAQ